MKFEKLEGKDQHKPEPVYGAEYDIPEETLIRLILNYLYLDVKVASDVVYLEKRQPHLRVMGLKRKELKQDFNTEAIRLFKET